MGLHGIADLKRIQDKMFKSTYERCDQHDVTLIQYQDNTPFCPLCASERAAADEKKLRDAETEKAHNHKRRWLKQRSIVTDPEMFKMTFDTFEVMDEETELNKEKALNIARRYYKGSKGNELLTGRFGTGKTHLAMAILNQLNEHENKKILFVSIDELMRRIKTSFDDPSSPYKENLMVNTLVKADLLVLDDLGAEVGSVDRHTQATDYTVRVLNGILNGRTNKPTIFTTNLTMNELQRVYDGRIISRMFRGVKQERIIQFKTTPDKRTQINF